MEQPECIEPDALYSANQRPDYAEYGKGPYLELVAAGVRLARRDLAKAGYADSAREWLRGPLVALFAECIGYGGSFESEHRTQRL